jgi:hypothetical protein
MGLVLLCAGLARSQTPQYQLAYRLDGNVVGGRFGWSMDTISDVNGDGLEDLVVGASYASSAYLYAQQSTGATLLMRIDSTSIPNYLGSAVAGIGDVTGDGVPDFVCSDNITQYALWCDGADRTIGGHYTDHPGFIQKVRGINTQDYAHVMEHLGDGGDVLVATGPSVGGLGTMAKWYTTNSGTIVEKLNIQAYSFTGGSSIRNVGDVVGNDGIDDFLLSSSENPFDHRGRVSVISGACTATGTVTVSQIESLHFDGPSSNTDLGMQSTVGQNPLALAGDINGDGIADFAIGAPLPVSLPEAHSRGQVLFYSGVDGALLSVLTKPSSIEGDFGAMVENIGDITGDGHAEIAIGSRSSGSSGIVLLYSPCTGEYVGALCGDSNGDLFGRSILSLGDLNGDGLGDLAISAPFADFAGANSGSVYVYMSVPEPATMSLLAVGLGAVLVRRRKR